MSAEELRRYIMLVESATVQVAEAGISRRGLFKSAAAVAAVAALPQQAREQAVELIKSAGPELVQAAQAIHDSGLDDADALGYAHSRLAIMFGERIPNLSLFDTEFMDENHYNKIQDALYRLTGKERPDTNEDWRDDELWSSIKRMPPDARMELFNKAYVEAGAGTEWKAHTLYRIFKRFPSVLNLKNIDRSLLAASSLLPGGDANAMHDRQSRTALEMEMQVRKLEARSEIAKGLLSGRLDRWDEKPVKTGDVDRVVDLVKNLGLGDDPDIRSRLEYIWKGYSLEDDDYIRDDINELQNEIKHAKNLISQHRAATGKAPMKASVPSGGKASAPSPSVLPPSRRLSLLRTAIKIINAFSNKDRITDRSLDILKDIRPEDIKLTMQADAGQEPGSPQQPAALPAPRPGIDLGLDRDVAKEPIRRDQD